MNNIDYKELQKLIEINSWTGNKQGVDSSAALFSSWIAALDMECIQHKREEIGDHLHYISQKREGKKLLLLGHLDTVFPPDTFEAFKEDEEWIYGPGVCDMKGGNYIALLALRAIYEKFGKIENIDLLLVSDEETGSDDSKLLTSELAKAYDYCMVFEAAGKGGEIVTGRKGAGTFFVEITGKAAHAGNHYSDGADANLEAAIKLQKLVMLTDLEKQTTINVGKIEGGLGANTISPGAKLVFELRYTSKEERDRVLEAMDTILHTAYVEGTTSLLSGGIQRDVLQPNNAQSTWIERINTLCDVALPTEQRGGVSDANVVASAGTLVTDGWGPFGDGDHTVHERASKQSFEERIKLVTEIFEHHTEGRL